MAIGVIDTMGYVSTLEALDVCLKTADVQLAACERVKGGIVSCTITGEVAAVSSAVDAGVAAAKRLGGYLHHTVIARIDEQTQELFEKAPTAPEPKPLPEEDLGHKETSEAPEAPEPEPVLALNVAKSEALAAPKADPKPEAAPVTKPVVESKVVPAAQNKEKPKREAKQKPQKKAAKKPRKKP